MSQRFKSQDYFRYPKLRKKWRRPVGLQSKLRIKKGGSGMKVAIGYGTANATKNRIQGLEFVMVNNANEIVSKEKAVLIASGVGAKKTLEIAEKAKTMGVRVLNMNKVKHSKRTARAIEARRESKKQKKKEEVKAENKENKEANKEDKTIKESKAETKK